jgi:hypothetical protein
MAESFVLLSSRQSWITQTVSLFVRRTQKQLRVYGKIRAALPFIYQKSGVKSPLFVVRAKLHSGRNGWSFSEDTMSASTAPRIGGVGIPVGGKDNHGDALHERNLKCQFGISSFPSPQAKSERGSPLENGLDYV